MKTRTIAILILVSGAALAQSPDLKPGLWEFKPIHQVVDGRDMAAQMAAASAKMEQAMANMTPEQRKQMEAMMSAQGMSNRRAPGGGTRICVSPAMAAKDKPMLDSDGRCEPAKVNRSGDKTSFEFNCTSNGRTQVGSGESIVSGDTVTTRMDMTMTDSQGRHTVQNEIANEISRARLSGHQTELLNGLQAAEKPDVLSQTTLVPIELGMADSPGRWRQGTSRSLSDNIA